MPGYYELEALKAQALVARTYLYKKIQEKSEDGCDICDNANHCQAYLSNEKLEEIWKKKGYDENTIYDFWYKANEAVSLTQNEIITYNGSLINAFFHASSPYKTENVDQIWGKEKVDYLVSVENVEDEEDSDDLFEELDDEDDEAIFDNDLANDNIDNDDDIIE